MGKENESDPPNSKKSSAVITLEKPKTSSQTKSNSWDKFTKDTKSYNNIEAQKKSWKKGEAYENSPKDMQNKFQKIITDIYDHQSKNIQRRLRNALPTTLEETILQRQTKATQLNAQRSYQIKKYIDFCPLISKCHTSSDCFITKAPACPEFMKHYSTKEGSKIPLPDYIIEDIQRRQEIKAEELEKSRKEKNSLPIFSHYHFHHQQSLLSPSLI